METLWFILLWWMFATYVVLDGFDFGAGMLHLLVARSEAERRQVVRSLGPVWDANEVWLLAAAATMFFAFPVAFAVSFSGFYLPLMIVLWLLIGRGLGIELRHQLDDRLWTQFWDVVFAVTSLLLAVFFGAALGNVVRGVPLTEDGTFFEPLWTDFRVGEHTGILDWYTLLIALTATVAVAHHGALWLGARTDEDVRERAGRLAGILWPILLALSLIATAATALVQPNVSESLTARPWVILFPLVALGGLVGALVLRKRGRLWPAFLASAAYLYGMVACAALGIYPYLLPGRDPALGLTVHEAASPKSGLVTALAWWVPGMLLVCVYFCVVQLRLTPRTVSVHDSGDH